MRGNMYKTASIYVEHLKYVIITCVIQSTIMLYIFTGDLTASVVIAVMVFLVFLIITYSLSSKKIIITDEGIKTRLKLFKWNEVSLIAVYPDKFITIYLKLPGAIHRVGVGIRVRSSDIAQYTIKYDEELVDIFKDKVKDKVQIKNIPYYSFNSLINDLKNIKN